MKRARFFALGLLVALSPVQVEAQLYQGTPPAQADFEFVGPGSAVAGTFGVYVGPYVGNLVGDGFGPFSIYCVDYRNMAGDMSPANISPLSGPMTNTRIGTQTQYLQAAYLSSLFDSWESHAGGYGKTAVWSGLHAAIWGITSDVNVGGSNAATLDRRTYFMGLAANQNNYGSVNPDEWFVITNADLDAGGQEFLVRRSVPEPTTLLLMLTGLLLLVGVSRKRLLALQDL